MKELLENAKEFRESGVENLEKKRYNASASDFFKSIVIFCDYLIYDQIKRLPKNHNDRFNLLNIYFKKIYEKVNFLFGIYVKSYNLKMNLKEVFLLKEYSDELEGIVNN
jgi:HEPN domain-containing protein